MRSDVYADDNILDIEILKTFIEVRNTRHFGKAAENLYISQAAVSARVKQLEDNLGIKVFIRSRNNIQLTAEGERLVPYAESMLVAWSRARQDVSIKQQHTHQLSIGTTAGLWNYVLENRLSSLHHNYPEIALRAETHTSDDLLRLVLDRTLDIIISYESNSMPELSAHPIGKLKLVLCSTDPDVNPRLALFGNYAYVDWGTAFGIFHAKRFGEVPPAILHTNMASIAEAFIREHGGAAFLPDMLLKSKIDDGLHAVDGAPSYSRDLYLVYRSNSDQLKQINDVISHLSS